MDNTHKGMGIKDIAVTVIFVIALALSIVAFVGWSANMDVKRAEAAKEYDACVQEEFGRSPQSMLAELGYYPDCAR